MIPIYLCSMPVNDEIIQAVLDNPDVTVKDLYALEASVANQDGMASHWINEILDKEAGIVLAEYLATKGNE